MTASIEIQFNNRADTPYVGFAAAPCRIRSIPAKGPLDVKLASAGTVGKVRFYGLGAAPGAATDTLALTLPADGSWVSFWLGGAFGSPSIALGDAAVSVTASWATTPLLSVPLMVRIRKNANKLTDSERDRFLTALVKLNKQQGGPFQIARDTHAVNSVAEAHQGPAFLPWHRAYLISLERALQTIDPSVTLPYWKFDEPAPNLFSAAFVGFWTGPYMPMVFNPTNPLQLWSISGIPGVQRTPQFPPDGVSPLQRSEAYCMAIGGTTYSAFQGLEKDPHNNTHARIFSSGWITNSATAPQDPLFFLLHCNLDRIWAKWQWLQNRFGQDPATSYASASRIGHNFQDTMWPWNGIVASPRPPTAPGGGFPESPCTAAPGPMPTVASMLDYQGKVRPAASLGFDYDDVPFA